MTRSANDPSCRLALVGKGGTGKSALTALITRHWVKRGKKKLLLIDADPTMGLCQVLGIHPSRTLEDLRHRVITVGGRGRPREREELVYTLDYHLFEALTEAEGFALLAMGQPRESGCFCPANTLLKKAVESLSRAFEAVLIDCEAGLEQVSRKVIGGIDRLIIVTDPTRRGFRTAQELKKAAARFTRAKDIGLVVNRVKPDSPGLEDLIRDAAIPLLGCVPEDDLIARWDLEGRSVWNLPDEAESVRAVENILSNLFQGGCAS